MATLRIIVDGDACPVKKEIVSVGEAHRVQVLIVASYAHMLRDQGAGVTIVQVDPSDQAVDLYIANHIRSGDILVTGDYGLAALGLAKGGYVLAADGRTYTNENIEHLLDRRHTNMKWRRRGKYSKGPKPFTDKERSAFLQSLTKLLQTLQENEIS